MRQNIKNNHIKKLDSKLYGANYHDFMLFNGNTISYNEEYLNNLKIVDINNNGFENYSLYSNVVWEDAINEGIEMNDIGFTGVDNGLISFRKDSISNKEILDLFCNSCYKIPSGDTRFFMSPITGNTLSYNYPLYLNEEEDCIEYKGGFFQGFFKLFGHNYQVLPTNLDNDITLHFELRPRNDYEIQSDTINSVHPNNKGIFFYIGTRAENKFWHYYKMPEYLNFVERELNLGSIRWVEEETDPENFCPHTDNKFVENEYIGADVEINETDMYSDSLGREHNKRAGTEIESDNKFLMFDRTPTGFTTKNWIEGTKVVLNDQRNWSSANYFILMNRTKTGYTTNNINEYNENNSYEYNIYKDLYNNAFALRITDSGAIGYRYIVFDCEKEEHFSIKEEYSKDDVVKINEWNKINVRFIKTANSKDKMRILFYVNGFLVFISEELDNFNFKELDDVSQKQECVPYNISLGGGTLGLMESIMPNNMELSKYILPLEEHFCGSFLGDIKTFKMYNGFIDYSTIKNYLS
jgi:hypothetical protein